MKQTRLRAAAALLLFFLSLKAPLPYAFADTAASPYGWPAGPSLDAEAAVLIEPTTGLVLYEKNAHEKHYPASTTKLMTTLLAIENASLNETVTCSYDSVYGIEFDSSRIWVDVGEELLMQDALYAVMLASANDVAYAVAEHVGGTFEGFVQLMNDRAAELGCTDTHFMNPHGLDDPEHYTSAYDLAMITRAAIRYPIFRKVSGSRNYEMPATNLCDETRWISNTHRFIRKTIPYDGVFAGKTGYTDIARTTLVTCAERNGLTLICVLMKVSTGDQAYVDAANLLDFGFNNFTIYDITENALNTAPTFPSLFDGKETILSSIDVSPIRVSDASLVLPYTASYSDAVRTVTLKQLLQFTEGDNIIGRISYTYGDREVGSADIIYRYTKQTAVSFPFGTAAPPDAVTEPSEEQKKDLRPVIIGTIIAVIVLCVGLYIVLIELPYRRKRAAYNAKRRREREIE